MKGTQIIGVLFGCFGRKIDGPAVPGGFIIYQGHLFAQKDTHADWFHATFYNKTWGAAGVGPNSSRRVLAVADGPAPPPEGPVESGLEDAAFQPGSRGLGAPREQKFAFC